MKWIHTTALALALAPVFAVSSGCDPKEAPKQPTVVAAPVIRPTAERALQRAQERWNKGMEGPKKDWVAAYDFAAPEFKREQSLARYLTGIAMHRYENMRAIEVLAVQGDKAFVRVGGLWTPVAQQVRQVKLEPGQSLTQEITLIETWRFVDGDWCYVRPDHEADFFESHPDLLKKGGEPTPPPAPPAPK